MNSNLLEAINRIGQAGKPWGTPEKEQWRQLATKKRDYTDDVVSQLGHLPEAFVVEQYGSLDYDVSYPLYVVKNKIWYVDKPAVVITGGVHGYERSGVHGALQFLATVASDYLDDVNFIVFPCISPWGYETINRWTPLAADPNRSFVEDTAVAECAQVMNYLSAINADILMHIDLHETTDTDESEFRPALAARDGETYVAGLIPDGFYLVADSERVETAFQTAILDKVKTVTHIAPADENNQLIDCPILQEGLIAIPMKKYGLSGNLTKAPYHTTTEVYPDSPNVTTEQCNAAQVAAIVGGLDFVLKTPTTPKCHE